MHALSTPKEEYPTAALRAATRDVKQVPIDPSNRNFRDQSPREKECHPRARNDYDEETAHESYMNPEPGFQSGPGDSVDAD